MDENQARDGSYLMLVYKSSLKILMLNMVGLEQI